MTPKSRLIAIAVTTTLWPIHALGVWESIPALLRLVLATIYFLSPGVWSLRLLGRRWSMSWLTRGLYGISLSLAVCALCNMVFYGLELDVDAITIVVGLWLCVLLILYGIRLRGPAAEPRPSRPLFPVLARASALPVWSALALVILPVAFLAGSAGPEYELSKDTLDHIGYLDEIVETGKPFPSTAFHKDAQIEGLDPRKSLYHVFLAGVASFASVPGNTLWRHVPGPYTAFFLLCVYHFGAFLVRSSFGGLAAVFVFVFLLHGGIWGDFFRGLAYPHHICGAFFFLVVPPILTWLESGSRKSLSMALLITFLLPTVHVYYIIQLAFVMVGLGFASIVSGRERAGSLRRYAVVGAGMVAVTLPFSAVFMSIFEPANPIHQHVQGVMFVNPGYWTMDPTVFFRHYGPLGVAGVLLSLTLLPKAGRSWSSKYLLAACWIPPLVSLNPVFLPKLQTVLGYLPYRLVWLAPTSFLLPYLWKEFGPFVQTGSKTRRTVLWIAIGLIALPGLWKSLDSKRQRDQSLAQTDRTTHRAWSGLIDFLAGSDQQYSVILADPMTSYSIPAFTTHYVVCTLDQHSSPNDRFALERILTSRTFFSPLTSPHDAMEALEKSGADFVVLNHRIPDITWSDYWSMSRSMAEIIDRRMANQKDRFELVFGDEAASLYRVLPAGDSNYEPRASNESSDLDFKVSDLPEDVVRDGSYFPVGLTFGDSWSGKADPDQEVRIELVAHELEALTAAGDDAENRRLAITTYWRLESTHPTPGKFMVYYRFDTDFPRGAGYRASFGKIYRKLQEKKTGRLYRFRSQRLLTDGLLPPDLWKPGDLIRDRHLVSIPSNAAEGDFALSICVVKETHMPNYLWSDFFRNDDRLQGPAIGLVSLKETGAGISVVSYPGDLETHQSDDGTMDRPKNTSTP